MRVLMQNIVLISFMCTVVILVMLLVRKALIKHTSAWWRSAVWMLILIRMCIPLTVETPIGILKSESSDTFAAYDNTAYEYIPSENLLSDNVEGGGDYSPNIIALNNAAAQSKSITLTSIFGFIYFIGLGVSLMLLMIKFITQRKYLSNLKICRDNKIINSLNAIKKQTGIKHNVSMLIDSKGTMPIIYGLIKPKIILPQKAIKGDLSELNLILAHELTHIRQFDILKLWIIEISTCINWFNPAIYLIKNIITQDIELACDEKVLVNTHKSNHYEYSRIIAEYSTKHKFYTPILSSGINPNKSKGLKTRLDLIIRRSKKSFRIPGVIIATITLIFLTACTTMNIANTLPKSFDWRDKGVVTSPQNQGEYGAGSIFASVSMLESNIALTTNELVNLSEQYFINNTDKWSSQKGISPALVLDFLAEKGTVLDEQQPYTGIKETSSNTNSSYKLSSWDYFELSDISPDEKVETIKHHLIEYGPVITPVTLYYDLLDYDGGVYQWDEISGADFGHWVTIVGWKNDKKVEGGGYWIVKESWGSDWGEDGYIRIAYNDGCGIDDYLIYYIESPTT